MDENGIAALIGTTQCLIGCGCTLLNILVIVLCVTLAQRKNRSPVVWGLLGFFFSIFALFLLLLMPTVQPNWPVVYAPPPPNPYPQYPPPAAPYVAPPAAPYAAPPPPVPPPGSASATVIHGGWRLTIAQGPDAGQSYALGVQARLGRGPDNEIRISDPQASRFHAIVQRQRDNYVLTDQGSGNGTFVNGQLISKPTPLSPGDTITIGNTQITVG